MILRFDLSSIVFVFTSMRGRVSEQDERSLYAKSLLSQLEVLSQGYGLWRDNLLAFMQQTTPDLLAYWQIVPEGNEDHLRDAVQRRLWHHFKAIPAKEGKPWTDDRADIFRFAFGAGFNLSATKNHVRLRERQRRSEKDFKGRRGSVMKLRAATWTKPQKRLLNKFSIPAFVPACRRTQRNCYLRRKKPSHSVSRHQARRHQQSQHHYRNNSPRTALLGKSPPSPPSSYWW